MNRNTKSFLGGAAVAAFLIAPGFSQTHPAHPPAPPAPPAAPAHVGDWADTTKTFNAGSVKLEDVVGTVIVKVRDKGPMIVEVAGATRRVNAVRETQDDGRLHIDGASDTETDQSIWDWKNWFNFPRSGDHQSGNLIVTVTVPRGSEVSIEDLVGDATIGDTMGVLRLDAAATTAHIGNVAQAKIDLGGSGHIEIASVTGALDLDVGGAGKIVVGPTGSVKADIAGSGDATFGPIAGGMSLGIAGSGDVTAARVNGPVKIEIAGSGSVRIAEGTANPLRVEMMGAGNVWFGGVAIDPHVEAMGAGSVHIKAYHGHLSSEGMADVKIGD